MIWYQTVRAAAEGRWVQELTFPPVIAQTLDLGDPGEEQTIFS